jgi:xylan 1,4-beta-xylosidase
MSIQFTCDLLGKTTPLIHFWEHTVGSGHAPLALRADWQAQLKKCKDDLGFKHVRFHGLLSSMMDTLTIEKDESLYSFYNVETIFDYLLSIGVRPFVELSFMPSAIASGHKTVFHYHSNVTPPKNYEKWKFLIKKLITHCINRYGITEVRQWFFEVWNEPNLKSFWTGDQKEYFKLYRATFETIKNIDPLLKVGGPATAKNAWIEDFVYFCEKHELASDFISTHHYPTDAFGKPGDNTLEQLADSRRSIMREETQDVFRQAKGKPIYYTEWSSSSNPRDALHDEPYAAAFITKTIMEANGLVEGYSYWTFSDIFQENYFPSIPFQGGFGLLNLQGIPKPAYRAFQLLHDLGNEKLLVDGLHRTVDAWVIKKDIHTLTVLLVNHALPKHSIKSEKVKVELLNVNKRCSATVLWIDDSHANPKKLWLKNGKPEYLSTSEVEHLIQSSELKKENLKCKFANSKISFEVIMAPHSVAAITLKLK